MRTSSSSKTRKRKALSPLASADSSDRATLRNANRPSKRKTHGKDLQGQLRSFRRGFVESSPQGGRCIALPRILRHVGAPVDKSAQRSRPADCAPTTSFPVPLNFPLGSTGYALSRASGVDDGVSAEPGQLDELSNRPELSRDERLHEGQIENGRSFVQRVTSRRQERILSESQQTSSLPLDVRIISDVRLYETARQLEHKQSKILSLERVTTGCIWTETISSAPAVQERKYEKVGRRGRYERVERGKKRQTFLQDKRYRKHTRGRKHRQVGGGKRRSQVERDRWTRFSRYEEIGEKRIGRGCSGGTSAKRCCRQTEENGRLSRSDGRRMSSRTTTFVFLALLCAEWLSCGSGTVATGQKYSTRLVRTRYGTLRGVLPRSSMAVETYYGVPYATPPLGALRYMPPVTPTPWRGTRLADTMPPACPQRPPELQPTLPRNTRAYLQRIAPLLANQSEDCLYLNLYVPQPSAGNTTALLPALLMIHGDSYLWGTGNSLDGSALAAHGRIIVVSINFRLGVLGFLKTGPKSSVQGNYGLMDLVAGLHWLRENLKAFGGDPDRLALLGQGTGAALANFLAVSPMAKELVKRVILLGGSALSAWAVQRDPLAVKRRVADQTSCPSDVETDDIAPCLRLRNVDDLLDVQLDPPRFTSGFAPFVDGTVLPLPTNQNFQPTVSSAGIIPLVPGPGTEFADFGDRDLLLGLTSDEAWVTLTEDDMQNGLNETRRDRILRTYVRNTYRYHLHEIYSTLRNEYTDWERGEQSPFAICEGLLSLLGDGQVAAPLLRLALLHSSSGGHDYFLHFQPGDRPSQRGEEMPYLLGLPLHRAELAAGNYTPLDENLSRLLVHYVANFVRRGDPNGASSLSSVGAEGILSTSPPFWDRYDSLNQLYLEIGRTTEMRSHYRGHKMSLWLNLLPQLHRPGYEISMRHHHLSESPSLYEGAVRPQTMALPLPAPPLPMPAPTEPSTVPSSAAAGSNAATTECTPNTSATTSLPTTSKTVPNSNLGPGPNNLLRKLASSHYQSYTTALTVTIAVGVFLLLLNILIFAGIYHQRDRNSSNAGGGLSSAFGDKKKEELLEAGCSGIEAVSSKQRLSAMNLMDSPPSSPPPHKAKLVQELELQLQEFQCSPPPGGGKRIIEPPSYSRSPCLQRTRTPSPCVDATTARMDEDDDNSDDSDDDNEDIPEPPPPPKVPAPNVALACPGILRQPGTPGSAKKRVQIQEISV